MSKLTGGLEQSGVDEGKMQLEGWPTPAKARRSFLLQRGSQPDVQSGCRTYTKRQLPGNSVVRGDHHLARVVQPDRRRVDTPARCVRQCAGQNPFCSRVGFQIDLPAEGSSLTKSIPSAIASFDVPGAGGRKLWVMNTLEQDMAEATSLEERAAHLLRDSFALMERAREMRAESMRLRESARRLRPQKSTTRRGFAHA
jgi:hypothetical protein